MKVRFVADADLNKAIVTGVQRREPSVDFLTAQAAGLRRMRDPEVLALAAEQQPVLVFRFRGTSHARRERSTSALYVPALAVRQGGPVRAMLDSFLNAPSHAPGMQPVRPQVRCR